MRRTHLLRSGGLTLVELMIAMTVTAMILAAMTTASIGVQQSYEYGEGYATATQHAQVVLERIARTVSEATASEQFPGVLALADKIGVYRYPDTLVVWHPVATAADPTGLPRMNEVVVYCPNPANPCQLWEMTAPVDARIAPAASDTAAWASEVAAMRASGQAKKTVLTALMRTCVPTGASAAAVRAALRFETRLRPSADEWTQFKGAALAWEEMSWAQGVFGPNTGLRQAWMRVEIQLMPGTAWSAQDPANQRAATFFGSSSIYYELNR